MAITKTRVKQQLEIADKIYDALCEARKAIDKQIEALPLLCRQCGHNVGRPAKLPCKKCGWDIGY